MHTFGIVFLAALAAATVTRLFLASRHLNHVRAHRDRVPDAFTSEIGLAAHQKAADYTCAKTGFAMIDLAVGALVVLALTFGGAILLGVIQGYAPIAFPKTEVWNHLQVGVPGVFLFLVLLALPDEKLSVGRLVGRDTPAVPGLRDRKSVV